MKQAKYLVELSFSECISDGDADLVAESILNRLIDAVHTLGLLPDNAPGFTQVITVERISATAFIGKDLCTGELV